MLPSLVIKLIIASWVAPISALVDWAMNNFVIVPSERLSIGLLLVPFSPLGLIRVEILVICAGERLAWDLPGIAALPSSWVVK